MGGYTDTEGGLESYLEGGHKVYWSEMLEEYWLVLRLTGGESEELFRLPTGHHSQSVTAGEREKA